MSDVKKIPLYVAVFMGVYFIYALATQTPRQGRGPGVVESAACAGPLAIDCPDSVRDTVQDPLGVWQPVDSTGSDSLDTVLTPR